ncbi:ArgS-related anticodon-binding protein NrtL [Streptomyces sp. AK04-3B]|uniref:ArgS-related anticodon-binding protein NrtL n=1 Tax=Streptomyces sp. AK04-3B TaxID=3028650 RepID=UPI0029BAAF5D|nr:DALR anticodon-binding domain-containing protein [Streptomyces sp. AK04-3B]MDX3800230.1 DALR anticodon-binding domain-containing protein [Streptomyces sp. AK04-3B]
MTPVELSRTVLRAVRRAVEAGELSVDVPARAVVAPPGPGGRGDYATNIALQLARPAGQPPLRVAEVLRSYLAASEGVARVEITGPGFLNLSLDGSAAAVLVRRVLGEGPRYGHDDRLAGRVFAVRVPYEIRAEVVADALARIVAAQGGRVDVSHDGPVTLRPAPAPEDPAALGLDAARWALLHPAPHDRPRVTADHLVQRESNPVFRVRYAHARTRAVRRNAADLGFGAWSGSVPHDALSAAVTDAATDAVMESVAESVTDVVAADFGLHVPAEAHELLSLLADYPRILATAVTDVAQPGTPGLDVGAPSRLARHLLALADVTLVLLPVVLPRGEEKPSAAHRARLALAEAAGAVLAGGLSLLGIDAPDHL